MDDGDRGLHQSRRVARAGTAHRALSVSQIRQQAGWNGLDRRRAGDSQMKPVANSPRLLPYLAGMSIGLALCLYGAGGVVIAYIRAAWICIGAVGLALFTRSARMN